MSPSTIIRLPLHQTTFPSSGLLRSRLEWCPFALSSGGKLLAACISLFISNEYRDFSRFSTPSKNLITKSRRTWCQPWVFKTSLYASLWTTILACGVTFCNTMPHFVAKRTPIEQNPNAHVNKFLLAIIPTRSIRGMRSPDAKIDIEVSILGHDAQVVTNVLKPSITRITKLTLRPQWELHYIAHQPNPASQVGEHL